MSIIHVKIVRPSVERLEARRLLNSVIPVGPEVQVNTHTNGEQYYPTVAMDAAGDSVVVWGGADNQDGDSFGIFAQRYDPAGAPQGGEFQVNTYTPGAEDGPQIAMDGHGDFVVAWT